MRLAYLFPLLAIMPSFLAAQTSFIEPEGDVYVTDDGTVALAWEPGTPETEGGDLVYEVRRSASPDFTDPVFVYEGQDTASFVSGLPEGNYYFKIRARSIDGEFPPWGEAYLLVTVDYIEPGIVILLMSAGLVTFIAVIASIVMGHRAAKREPASEHV